MAENMDSNTTKENTQVELLEKLASDETLEITIKKTTNEVILRNPKDGRIVTLKANLEDTIQERIEDEDDNDNPLTPEEFEKAIKKIDQLGYTFTADLFPSIVPKKETTDLINDDEFESLEEKYPTLPREVGLVIFNVLTEESGGLDLIGGTEQFEQKSEIVKKLIITDEFRAEFFFRHALKVPYLESIDWEVILKTHERGVKGVINTPYALLMLTFHNTNPRVGKLDIHKNITVAVNRVLIDKILATLTRVRVSLEESEKMRDILANSKSLME